MVRTTSLSQYHLLSETRQLLEYTIRLARRDVVLAEETSDLGHNAAITAVPEGDAPHVLRFDPGLVRYLDHLIAHECGHLIRFYSAGREDRLVPTSTRHHFAASARQLGDDLYRLHRQGLPEEALSELATMYHQGLVHQLVNFPADMRIERCLKETYHSLTGSQQQSIREQLTDNEQILRRAVMEFTPATAYDASAAMNAAYASYMARLYTEPRMAGRYRYTKYWRQGDELANDVWFTKDQGHAGDVATAKGWARLFGLGDWLEWKHVDEIRRQR